MGSMVWSQDHSAITVILWPSSQWSETEQAKWNVPVSSNVFEYIPSTEGGPLKSVNSLQAAVDVDATSCGMAPLQIQVTYEQDRALPITPPTTQEDVWTNTYRLSSLDGEGFVSVIVVPSDGVRVA